MNTLKKLFFSAVTQFDIKYLKRKSNFNLLAPYYHLISNEPVPYLQHIYQFKNTRQFENDLDYMLKHFNPVTLNEVINHIKLGTQIPKHSFLITLDDGLKQVHDIIMPVLLRKGVPAALFIVPAFLNNKNLFYDLKKGLIIDKLLTQPTSPATLSKLSSACTVNRPDVNQIINYVKSINYLSKEKADELGNILEIDFDNFLHTEQPFMTTAQVDDFIGKGFGVGAHSLTHPRYSLVPLEQQVKETQESLKWVANTFSLPYKAFAFPHVDKGVSQQFFDTILTADNTIRPDIIFGNTTAMRECNPHIFHRYIGENPNLSAENMVKAVLSYNLTNKLRGKTYLRRSG